MVKYTLTFFEWSVSIVRKKMVKVTFENGTEIMVEPETRVIDAIRLANIKTDEEILAVKINRVHEVNKSTLSELLFLFIIFF